MLELLKTNEALFFESIAIYLAFVLIIYRLFGKNGLYVFTAFATIMANVQVCKSIDLFGFSATGGNELYAASFLVTDILSERYGKKSAQKAVYIGLCVTLLWLTGTQLTVLFTPNESDMVNDGMKQLFALAPRVCIASFVAYAISQTVDVTLYHKIWDKSGNTRKFLWLRNNGSTLTSQLVDSVVFTTIAFIGQYPTDVFISIVVTTYLLKAIVALLDTPFMYAARKVKPIRED